MLWLYKQYRDDPKAWWNDDPLLGGDSDGFTVTDFFILILYFEMADHIAGDHASNQNKYAYAIAQKYSYECARYSIGGSCSGISNHAMLNYLAIRGSAQMRYDAVKWEGREPSSLDPYKNYDLNAAIAVVTHALESISLYGSQADWGNKPTGELYWTGPTGPPGILYVPQLGPPVRLSNPNRTVAYPR
jgi:hypothetical protein